MSEKFSYDVFLSYSAKDRDVVRDVAERLKNDGLGIWFDEWEIKPGDNIPHKVEEGLEQSRVLVLCMSKNAFGSEWAKVESHTFRFRDPLNKDRRFLSLRFDDAPIKGSLTQFLNINWFPRGGKEEYLKLLESCRPPAKSMAVEAKAWNGRVLDKFIHLSTIEGDIRRYSFSSDGKRVLTSCNDKTLKLWDLGTGHCLRVLESEPWEELSGFGGGIWCLQWSTDQRHVLSGDCGGKVRLWDVETGVCSKVFDGHTSGVETVAWSPDGHFALSGDMPNIRLWDLTTGRCLRVFEGHTESVFKVAWSRDGHRALSASGDGTLRLWEVTTGRCLRVFDGHTKSVFFVEWDTEQRYALSCSADHTLRLWDIDTGLCLRVLEGHEDRVSCVKWRVEKGYALSGSYDYTLRLWDLKAGRCVRVLKGHADPIEDVGWSPDGRRAFSGGREGEIGVWDLSEFVTDVDISESSLFALQSETDQVQYTNAKVLLVGDTGVGKSGLAERLVRKEFVPTKSSHARKAHVLESKVGESGGVSLHQETVLWDLAGQPAYRLVHQLSMEEASLACVLFDCRNEMNPFEGAAYWSQVLDQAHTNTKLKKILVASRVDVGGLPAGKERVEAFAKENGFELFISTSAFTGEGCEELLKAIRNGIVWDEIPKVTTTDTLAALRDYVSRLKGEKTGKGGKRNQEAATIGLLTIASLHEGFCAYFGKKIPLDEFIAHLQRLEATDALGLLVFHTTGAKPRSDTLVLLDPTRVDAYASALLVAAKDEPDGPGHLLESRIREGKFKLDEEERITAHESEQHLLWFVIEKLLSLDLALRERIKSKDYIVFPSQCTAELRFPGAAAFGVAFGFAGPVRSIYATLIAQLAHYEGFKKREFFQDAASYRAEEGGRCLVRLRDQSGGRGELEVLFEGNPPTSMRQGFLEFVGKHLKAKSNIGSVTKRHAYHCITKGCENPFEDRVVQVRLKARKKTLLCPICERKTPLVDLFVSPTAAAKSVVQGIDMDAKVGRRRMTAALVINAKNAEGKFDVFLSHNSRDKAAVEKIAKRLLKVGIRPWLDKWNLSPGDTVSDALEHAIKTIPCAALFFGPADIGQWHIMEIRAYVERWASKEARMIPVVLPKVEEPPELPLFVQQTLWVDMCDWEDDKSDGFYRLVCGILGRPPGDSPMRKFGVRNVAEWQGIDF